MSGISDASAGRWRRRPVLARVYRVYVLAGPLLTMLGVVFFGSELLPTSDSAAITVLRWGMIASLALTSAVLAERTLSRLLPVAALLDLDLGFPGAVPTRSRIASLASLRGGDAELMDLLPGIADRDLDAAAEHLMIRYASATRSGLCPRSHIDRVRALTAALAHRLDLKIADVDRLKWALLMRDVGSLSSDAQHPHQPLLEWLGPFAALVRGPYVDTAATGDSAAVRTAAHATAVADAYVVITAAHPYRRPAQSLPLDALTGGNLLPEALYALHGLSEQERRRATGMITGVSPLLARYTPRPQPVLTLASILAVLVLAVGAGIGPPPDAPAPQQTVAVSQPSPAPEPVEPVASTRPARLIPDVITTPGGVDTDAADETKSKRQGMKRGSATSGRAVAVGPWTNDAVSAPTYTDAASSRRTVTATASRPSVASSGSTSAAAATPKSSTPKSPTPKSKVKSSTKPKPSPKPSPTPPPPPVPTPTPPPPDPTPTPPPPDPTPTPDPDPPAPDPGPTP
ncbi:hypothetical protein BH23ACT10_BH23ACT10_02650 [soil metagenome]